MCNGVVKYWVSVSTQMQVLVLYSFWYRCIPNFWYSPARLFRSPSLQPFVHLAPDLLARHESETDSHGAQLLPPGGLVYSLTAAEVVTLPPRKMERKYALRRRSPGTAPYPQPRPSPSSEGSGAVSARAVLIKGCDVGRQLSLLEPIPEISHHLPRAICLAGSV